MQNQIHMSKWYHKLTYFCIKYYLIVCIKIVSWNRNVFSHCPIQKKSCIKKSTWKIYCKSILTPRGYVTIRWQHIGLKIIYYYPRKANNIKIMSHTNMFFYSLLFSCTFFWKQWHVPRGHHISSTTVQYGRRENT